MLADELDVELDEVRDWSEVWTAVEPIDCTMMHVEPGKVAAVRFAVEGVVDGEAVIIVEHVNRLTAAAAPDWPYPPEGKPGVHRVVVSGHPGIEINTHVGLGLMDHNIAGVIATGAKVVNAIPSVCAAEPGLVSLRDLPISQVAGSDAPDAPGRARRVAGLRGEDRRVGVEAARRQRGDDLEVLERRLGPGQEGVGEHGPLRGAGDSKVTTWHDAGTL